MPRLLQRLSALSPQRRSLLALEELGRGLAVCSPISAMTVCVHARDIRSAPDWTNAAARAMLDLLPRGRSAAELVVRDALRALRWERRRARALRHWLPQHLLTFANRLNAAQSFADVASAVSEALHRILGAEDVLLLLRVEHEATGDGSGSFRLEACDGSQISMASHPSLLRPGTVHLDEKRGAADAPSVDLSRLLTARGAAAAAHLPVGQEGIILLLERRADLVVEDHLWTLLHGLAAQAEGALRRIRTVEEARELSLIDPLTGLGNRRKMHVIMEHDWANARRGEELSLVLLDLDDFKRINDEQGHLAGDRILGTIADVLREQVRASDVVVRYGGDEFLILLRGQDRQGTEALIDRIRNELMGVVSFSAGVAAYRAGLDSVEDLLHEADLDLYSTKRRRYENV
jgi:diguanylate cyclase (GGDEF)-like protein